MKYVSLSQDGHIHGVSFYASRLSISVPPLPFKKTFLFNINKLTHSAYHFLPLLILYVFHSQYHLHKAVYQGGHCWNQEL